MSKSPVAAFSHFRDILSMKPKSQLSGFGFDDSKQESDLFEILACSNPEIINVRVKDESVGGL